MSLALRFNVVFPGRTPLLIQLWRQEPITFLFRVLTGWLWALVVVKTRSGSCEICIPWLLVIWTKCLSCAMCHVCSWSPVVGSWFQRVTTMHDEDREGLYAFGSFWFILAYSSLKNTIQLGLFRFILAYSSLIEHYRISGNVNRAVNCHCSRHMSSYR